MFYFFFFFFSSRRRHTRSLRDWSSDVCSSDLRLAALCNVGDNHDLRAARHAPAFAGDVEFDLAKAAGEGNLLWWRNVLVAKENDAVLVVGPLDRGERGIVERSGEIGAADLGAQSGAGRYDLERHRTS